MMGAEGGVGIGGEHLASSAFAADVLAGGESQGLRSDGG
jgi:hypothetical protein